MSVKHKLNASHRDAFRKGLLTKDGLLDNLMSSIDTNSVQSVNEVVNSSNTVSFSPSSCVNNAEWLS